MPSLTGHIRFIQQFTEIEIGQPLPGSFLLIEFIPHVIQLQPYILYLFDGLPYNFAPHIALLDRYI